jgi:hypothetical protein
MVHLGDTLTPDPSTRPIAPQRQNVNAVNVRGITAALLLSPLVSACSSAKPAGKSVAVTAGSQDMAGMSMPVTIPKGALFTEADVHFMQGMIAHHAQAIYMSRLAASHGANAHLLKFANKIDQSQMAEIRLMQDWLRANGRACSRRSSSRSSAPRAARSSTSCSSPS